MLKETPRKERRQQKPLNRGLLDMLSSIKQKDFHATTMHAEDLELIHATERGYEKPLEIKRTIIDRCSSQIKKKLAQISVKSILGGLGDDGIGR